MSKFIGGRKGPAIDLQKDANSGIYDLREQYQGSRLGGWDGGNVATGGIISDYIEPTGEIYRAHIFVAPGTFAVTSVDPTYRDVDLLVVAGGGGGAGGINSYWAAGAGGGGGVVEVSQYTVAPGSNYAVTVGKGGFGGSYGNPTSGIGDNGSDSLWDAPSAPMTIRAKGGGRGGASGPSVPVNQQKGSTGGCGGGAGASGNTQTSGATMGTQGGTTTQNFTSVNANYPDRGGIRQHGFSGGMGDHTVTGMGAGGGGAQGKGEDVSPPLSATGNSEGGAGLESYIGYGEAGIAITCSRGGDMGPANGGGGHGGHPGSFNGNGPNNDQFSVYGGGGCSAGNPNSSEPGGTGGHGVVIVRYRIGRSRTSINPESPQQATGGAISFYNGKTIHTFLQPGAFVTPSSFDRSVEFIVIGGGGSGGDDIGGGGGSGSLTAGTVPVTGAVSQHVEVGKGGFATVHPSIGDVRPFGNGGNSTWAAPNGTKTGYGGGAGGVPSSPQQTGAPGGSGGGNRGNRDTPSGGGGVGNAIGGNAVSPSPSVGWGNDGGGSSPGAGGGGGAGAGAPGQAGQPDGGGAGGVGLQIPSTFRNPMSSVGYPGPGGGGYWFAGGGGGGGFPTPNTPAKGGAGPGNAANYAGAGEGNGNPAGDGNHAEQNSGSGGGGAAPSNPRDGGAGGSGIVLLAYST